MTIPEERLAQISHRFAELEARLASGQLEGEAFVAASRDYAELEPVAKVAREVREEVALDLRPHWWYFGRQILTGIPLLILVILLLNLDGGWFKTGASWVIVALVIASKTGTRFTSSPASVGKTALPAPKDRTWKLSPARGT